MKTISNHYKVSVHLFVVNLLIEQGQQRTLKNMHILNILNAENGGKGFAGKKIRLMAVLHIDHSNFDMYTSFNVNSLKQ